MTTLDIPTVTEGTDAEQALLPAAPGDGGALQQGIALGVAPPPRWARRAAVLAALTTVPSALWRTAMAVGVPVGVDPTYRRVNYGFPGWGTFHVLWLTTLLVGLSFLTVGLVRPWGEVLPRWIPWIGGRRVAPLAAVIPASLGAVALALLWTTVFSNIGEIFVAFGLDGVERLVVGLCYTPLLLWSPLLAAVTVSYARRTMVHRTASEAR